MRRIILSLACMVGGIVVFGFVGNARAATFSVTPSYRAVTDQEQLIVDVRLNSENQVINAVQATLTYPVGMLDVVDVSHGGSFMSLWPQEPVVDKSAGTIAFVGGLPNGSRVVDGRLVRVTFSVKSIGDAEIGFNPEKSGAYLNDGLGTKAVSTFTSGMYKLASAVLSPIASPTHPDENTWYPHDNPAFQWTVESGMKYSYVFTDDQTKVPDNIEDGPVGTVTYKDVHDGIYYFVLSEQAQTGEWSIIGRRRIMIDTIAPSPIRGVVQRESTMFDGTYFLSFSSQDAMSGIDHYEIVEAGTTTQLTAPPYVLLDQNRQSAIHISAVDKAGNRISAVFGNAKSIPRESKTAALLQAVLIILALVLILAVLRLTDTSRRTK